MKFCPNCGKELQEGQEVCLNCGSITTNVLKKQNKGKHAGYKISTGIIMIILSFCVMCATGTDTPYDNPALVFLIPGLLGLIGGIFSVCSKNNKQLLLVSGILYLAGAFVNSIGILDISIFGILCIVFGILNIIFSTKEK